MRSSKYHQIARQTVKDSGHTLEKGEVVHHIDGNPMNNEQGNLVIATRKEHYWIHGMQGGWKTTNKKGSRRVDHLERLGSLLVLYNERIWIDTFESVK